MKDKRAPRRFPARGGGGDPRVSRRDAAAAALLRPLMQVSWSPEAFAVRKRFAYLWCPSGVAGSRLWNAADRLAGSAGTARNLATVGKLVAAARV